MQGSGAWYNQSTRSTAAGELGRFGASARNAAPALIEGLKTDNDEVFQEAASAVGMIGPDAGRAVPYLINGLQGHVPNLSQGGYPLLGDEYRGGGPYGLGDRYESLVCQALCHIGPPAVPELVKLLNDRKTETKYRAVMMLGGIGPDARDAVPALLKALPAANDDQLRVEILRSLARVGTGTGQGVAEVKQLLPYCPDTTYTAGITALGALGQAKEVVPFLIGELNKTGLGFTLRSRAIVEALGKFGPDASAAVPALKDILEDSQRDRSSEYEYVVQALGRIGPKGILVLREALKSPRPGFRVRAAMVLVEAHDDVEPTVNALVEIVRSGEYDQASAVSVLGLIGPRALNAVGVLNEALKSDDKRLRMDAALALWCIKRSVHLPLVEGGLLSENIGDRQLAARLLGEYGPQARTALPVLVRLSRQDPDAGVSRDAYAAIAKIDPWFGWWRRSTPQQQFELASSGIFAVGWLFALSIETFRFRWSWLRRAWRAAGSHSAASG